MRPPLAAATSGFRYAPDALWQPSDLSSIFSDLPGTTPAAVNGPVGKMLDRSGNGYHCTAPSTGARPTLRLVGGLYYLEFDGIAGRMDISGGTLSVLASTIGMAGMLRSGAGAVYLTGIKIGRQALMTCLANDAKWGGYAGTDLTSGATAAAVAVMVERSNTANSADFYKNGALIAHATAGAAYDVYTPSLGADAAGTQFSAMDFYGGAVMLHGATARELAAMHADLARLSGIALTA